MDPPLTSSPWDDPPLPPPRPMGLAAHVAGTLADAFLVVGLFLLGGAAHALLSVYFPRLRLASGLFDLTTWMLLLLYGTTEIFFAASPGKWFTTLTVRAPDAGPAPRRRLAL